MYLIKYEKRRGKGIDWIPVVTVYQQDGDGELERLRSFRDEIHAYTFVNFLNGGNSVEWQNHLEFDDKELA